MDNSLLSRKKSVSLTNPALLILSIAVAIPLGLLIRKFTQIPSDSFTYNILNDLNAILISIGKIYVNLLEMVIYPIILTSIVSNLAGVIKSKYLVQFMLRFVAVFIGFYFIFSVVGVSSGIIFSPGVNFSNKNLKAIDEVVQKNAKEIEVVLSDPIEDVESDNLFRFLLDIFPKNVFGALVNDMKIQIVMFSIMLGIAVGLLQGQTGEHLIQLFSGVLAAFQEIINWILYILPIGVLCLLSTQIAAAGTGILFAMAKFIVAFFFSTLLLIAFNTCIIWKRSKKSFAYVVKSLMNPIIVSLLTRNSFATLPVAIDVMDNRFNFFEKTSRLLLTFGITVGRFGNILYFSLAAVFVAQLYGMELVLSHYLVILISSVLAGIATAGTTGTAAVSVLAFVLVPLGLPVEVVIAVFFAIDILADPIRTLLIIHTNMAATSLITESVSIDGDRRLSSGKIKPRVKLRTSIVVLIVASIVLSGVTTFIAAHQGSKRSVYHLAGNMMQETADAVTDKTTNYMRGAVVLIKEMKYMFEEGGYGLDHGDRFLQLAREMLQINDEIGSIYLGAPDGSFAMTKRMLDGSFSQRIIDRTDENVTIEWIHENDENNAFFKDEILPIDQGYDPRTRNWYKSAIANNALIWEDVYIFSSDRIPGVTCAIPVFRENSELIGVLGIDIGIAEFSFFLGDFELSETGKVVLLNNKDEIIAIGADKSQGGEILKEFLGRDADTDTLNLVLAENSEDILIRESYLTYQSSRGSQKLPVFSISGEKYISYYSRFSPNEHFKWSIGIIIPEKSIMGMVNRNNTIVLTLASLFVLIALVMGLKFSKSVSKPLIKLSREMEKVQNFFLDDIEEVPSVIKEVNDMNSSFMNMVTGLRSFKKYVPSNLVARLINLGKEAAIGGERKTLTVFFSDIKNFTSISESLKPEQLVEELEKYLSRMSRTIIGNSGTVDKYMGDGIMAFWGAPDDVEDHALQACFAALECQAVLRKAARDNPDSILASFSTRIGLHTGEVIVGNMGSSERLDYTVIGDSVNLASRLESLNKIYGTGIIMSEATYDGVNEYVEARLLDKVAVKGKLQGVKIYELISKRGELDRNEKRFLKEANYGVALYFNKEWKKAYSVFVEFLRQNRNDVPARIMLKRCQEFLVTPPPENWDGVSILNRK